MDDSRQTRVPLIVVDEESFVQEPAVDSRVNVLSALTDRLDWTIRTSAIAF